MWSKFFKLFQVPKYRKIILITGIVIWLIVFILNLIFKTTPIYICYTCGISLIWVLVLCTLHSDAKYGDTKDKNSPG